MNMQKIEPSLRLYSPIVELRQYTLHPGQRDVLIHLFEREFVETQEILGMQVIGIFRDLDDPDRFVWLRGFADMRIRAEGLKAFYMEGAAWKTHRQAANATMVDSDNVLLLHPARPTSGFALDPDKLPPIASGEGLPGLVVATICSFDAPAGADFLDFFDDDLAPVLTEAGAAILASFVTEESVNDFPALPVREGEHVFVWFSLFQDQAAYDKHVAVLAASPRWRDGLSEALARRLTKSPQVLRLLPTGRSRVHG